MDYMAHADEVFTKNALIDLAERAKFHAEKFYGKTREVGYFSHATNPDSKSSIDNDLLLKRNALKRGHEQSPVNGVRGVFFSPVALGDPWENSHFGSEDLRIKPDALVSPKDRFYFGDFYCFNICHYATVVACKPGTRADSYCEQNLLLLDTKNNPFFRLTDPSEQENERADFSFTVPYGRLAVELLYASSVDLEELGQENYKWAGVKFTGRSYGAVRNYQCLCCNPNFEPGRRCSLCRENGYS